MTDRAELAISLRELADEYHIEGMQIHTLLYECADELDRQAATALSAEGGARAKSLSNVDVLTPVEFSDKRIQRALNLVVEHTHYFLRKFYFDQPMGDTKVMLADSCNQLFEARVAAKSTPAPQAPGEEGLESDFRVLSDWPVTIWNVLHEGKIRPTEMVCIPRALRDACMSTFRRLSPSADLVAAAKKARIELAALVRNPDDVTRPEDWLVETNEADRECLNNAFSLLTAALRSAGGE